MGSKVRQRLYGGGDRALHPSQKGGQEGKSCRRYAALRHHRAGAGLAMSNEQLALLMFTAYGDETTKLSARADFTRRGTCFPDERQKNRPLAPAMTTQKWRPVSGDHALSLYS